MQSWQKWQSSDKIRNAFLIREVIIKSVRNFFYGLGFHEAETPILVKRLIPESYLEYFQTTLLTRNKSTETVYLTASPEAALKKLLSVRFGNCFEITRSFRNTETDSLTHQAEFTMLEWYRTGADYRQSMKDIKNLYQDIFQSLQSKKFINVKDGLIKYRQKSIEFTKWGKISVIEALKKYAGIDFDDITDKKGRDETTIFPSSKIAEIARKKGYQIISRNSWEEIFNQIYLNEIEPNLGLNNPQIIFDFPKPMAALAKTKKGDNRLCERFELYIGGLELADCYSELTDFQEQSIRFKEEMKLRKEKNRLAITPDNEFLRALQIGLPESSGVALGIDRTVMLFADCDDIRDTRLFSLD